MRISKMILAAALGVASACGGGGGGGGGDVTIDKAPSELAAAICGHVFQCCDEQERGFLSASLMTPIPDEASCTTAFTGKFGGGFTDVQASVTAGRVQYHADKAGACIDHIDAASCGGLGFLDTDLCNQAFEGTVAAGGKCAIDEDCAGGFCKGATDGNVDGTCVATPKTGEACPDQECADGSFCNNDGMCAALVANGGACTGNDECQSNHCDMTGGAGGTCAAAMDSMVCDGK
jgi:hypothetical protein